MKYCLAILLFLFFAINVQSQNLIYNGDFEIYDTCPLSASSPPNDYYIRHCSGWGMANLGTSDFFHSCNSSINGFVSTPNNLLGFQTPWNGNGYLGFASWTEFDPQTDWFEYVQGKLIQPLVGGQEYEVKFHLSLAEASSYFSLRNIGFVCTVDSLNEPNSFDLSETADFVWSSTFLSDTSEWMELTGRFYAGGGEKFITFGYFPQGSIFEDSLYYSSDTLDFQYSSYYFIDGVSLIKVNCESNCSIQIPNVITPNSDGENDFIQFDPEGISEFSFRIYNRWGIEVFTSSDPQKKFQGISSNGLKLTEGVYFGVLSAKKYGKVIKQQQYIHVLY